MMNEATSVTRRVLLVDDVMLNRRLANAFMSKMGWETLEVDGGLLALAWLRSHPPVDLVLLDISMPDLSGEEVCKQLRADPAFANLKIIAYTAHAGQDDIERFLANGFDATLIKPISSQRLKDTVGALFPSAV
jgi:CheY-like chemotaxis protein